MQWCLGLIAWEKMDVRPFPQNVFYGEASCSQISLGRCWRTLLNWHKLTTLVTSRFTTWSKIFHWFQQEMNKRENLRCTDFDRNHSFARCSPRNNLHRISVAENRWHNRSCLIRFVVNIIDWFIKAYAAAVAIVVTHGLISHRVFQYSILDQHIVLRHFPFSITLVN